VRTLLEEQIIFEPLVGPNKAKQKIQMAALISITKSKSFAGGSARAWCPCGQSQII
jgi:hypothetical protein